MTTLKVYVVEDSPPVRARMRELINEVPDACLVGESESEAEAVLGIARTMPQLVILDINLSEGTGFEVLRQVKSSAPETVVAVVTNFGTAQFREKCQELGADYFYDKTKSYKMLVDLLHRLANQHHPV